MRISKISRPNFKGTYYMTTDSHSRTPMLAGVFTEIEKRAKDNKESKFYLDGGDYFGQSVSMKTTTDTFIKFHERNPEIKMIMNLGNADIMSLFNNPKVAQESINNLIKNGISVVSLTMRDIMEQAGKKAGGVLPYMIFEDEHNGKKEKILITGFCEYDSGELQAHAKDAVRLLKDIVLPVYKEEKPDEVILMSHLYKKETDEVLKQAEEMGIKNIKFVLGGHPHTLMNYKNKDTGAVVLYPPANGKGALVIQNDVPDIKYDGFKTKKDDYTYDPITKSKTAIANIDITEPLPIDPEYQELFETEECRETFKKIAVAPISLKYRNDYNYRRTKPSELGTFIANGYRDLSGADIGLFLSMDARERAPKKGSVVSMYNIGDTLNVEKDIYKYEGINADDLKEMMEASLKNQNDGMKNRNFVEYSDNLKIERFKIPRKNGAVKQIYIKENGKFKPLLDKHQKQLDGTKYTVATCAYLAGKQNNPPRAELICFAKHKSERVDGLTLRKCMIEQYKKFEREGIVEFHAAEIKN